MSQWIIDRRPTEEDGPMVYGPDGKVCHFKSISDPWKPWIRRGPWKPIPPCEPYAAQPRFKRPEPYVNRKRYTVHNNEYAKNEWFVWDELSKYSIADQIATQEAAERIAAIYEETQP